MAKRNARLGISAAFGALLLVAVAGCGDDSADADGGSGGGSAGGAQKVAITEPADGASVEAPFTLALDSDVELGATESGNHHVHLYFDGDDSKYEVIESDNVEVGKDSPALEGLESGEHELNISLRNADHSPAGFETSIMVEVEGGGGSGGGQEQPGTGGGY
jgi:hypothetical protein